MKSTSYTFNEENIKYVRDIFGDDIVNTFLAIGDEPERGTLQDQEDCEKVKRCLEAMEKSGNNHWWTSDDKKTLGYYSMLYPCQLVPSDKFHEALEFLLGRPVWIHEMWLNYAGLMAEAERAFKGTQCSEEERKESIQTSFNQLADSEKNVICVVVK